MRRGRFTSALALLLGLALVVPTSAVAEEDELVDLGALDDESTDLGSLGDDDGDFAAEVEGEEGDELAAGGGSGVRVNTICTNCNAASLTVNGLSGDRVEVKWDGMPAAGGLASVYYLTQFPSDFIGYTKVVRGPGSVLTGVAGIAGSIEFNSAKREERKTYLQAEVGDWGWRQLRAAAIDQWGPVGALVFVQGAVEDEYSVNDDDYNEVGEFERVTFQGIFDFKLSDRQTFTFGASFYGEDQLAGPGGPYQYFQLEPRIQEYRYFNEDAFFNWRQFNGTWSMDFDSGVRLKVDGRYSRRGQQQYAYQSQTDQENDTKQRTYQIEDELSYGRFTVESPAGVTGFVTAGLGWSKQRLGVVQIPLFAIGGNADPFWIVDGLESWEAFAQYDRSVGAKWDYSVGLRYDHMTTFGRTIKRITNLPPHELVYTEDDDISRSFVSPRGRVSFRPGGRWVFNWQLGRGILPPKPSFSETCCGAKYQRNLRLQPERIWSTQLQAEWKPTPDQRLTFSTFWTEMTNYHEKVVYKTTDFIPHYSLRALPKARVRGFDIVHDLRFRNDRYNVGWTYAYADSEILESYMETDDTTGDIILDSEGKPNPLDQTGRSLRYTPEHTASAYFRYNHVQRGTQFSVDATYTGGMEHFFLGEGDFGTRFSDEPWEFLKSESYWTFNTRVEQRIGKKGWSGYLGVNNVTDYYMPDLGNTDSAYDWGPIQGRFIFAGAKFLK
ncbi:MAG: TonB-dependent receptor [Acidobacteriota bacterium]